MAFTDFTEIPGVHQGTDTNDPCYYSALDQTDGTLNKFFGQNHIAEEILSNLLSRPETIAGVSEWLTHYVNGTTTDGRRLWNKSLEDKLFALCLSRSKTENSSLGNVKLTKSIITPSTTYRFFVNKTNSTRILTFRTRSSYFSTTENENDIYLEKTVVINTGLEFCYQPFTQDVVERTLLGLGTKETVCELIKEVLNSASSEKASKFFQMAAQTARNNPNGFDEPVTVADLEAVKFELAVTR